jgi:hypothetical protein
VDILEVVVLLVLGKILDQAILPLVLMLPLVVVEMVEVVNQLEQILLVGLILVAVVLGVNLVHKQVKMVVQVLLSLGT